MITNVQQDRFAAAIMLPKALTKALWEKFKKRYSDEKAILYIADMAAIPYIAVVRRLNELGETAPHLKREEEDWLARRHDLGFPTSVLDRASKGQRFVAYEQVVKDTVNQRGLDVLTAANKLSTFAPEQAEYYQQKVLGQGRKDET